jgi:glycosyltransferase involved in cell wall biosynthesis
LARISFAIPYYSGRTFLERAIASVRSQTISDWRLIVRDDCGPDEGVAHWLNSLGDERIAYRRNDSNLGLAGNWNACLQDATTEFVTLLHADDELLPEYGERLLTAAKSHPNAIALYCKAKIIDANGAAIFSLPDFVKKFTSPPAKDRTILTGEEGVFALLKGQFIFTPSLCYRTALMKNYRFDARWRMVLDLDLLTRILIAGEKIVGINDTLYLYRRHENNQTVILGKNMVRFDEEIAIYDHLANVCENLGWERASRRARSKTIVKLHLCWKLAQSMLRIQTSAAFEQWKRLKAIL